jgi:hypothetical protein
LSSTTRTQFPTNHEEPEILATNGTSTGQSLVNQRIASPGHERLMRDPTFKTIGVGVTRSLTAQYRLYRTVNLFAFKDGYEPAGAYATAQDFFDGKTTVVPLQTAPRAGSRVPSTG